jgi:hypothetical protein
MLDGLFPALIDAVNCQATIKGVKISLNPDSENAAGALFHN